MINGNLGLLQRPVCSGLKMGSGIQLVLIDDCFYHGFHFILCPRLYLCFLQKSNGSFICRVRGRIFTAPFQPNMV